MNAIYTLVCDLTVETEVNESMSQETNLWQVQQVFSLLNAVKN